MRRGALSSVNLGETSSVGENVNEGGGVSRFVFVLGAGASAAAKAPLGSNFMDKARSLLRGGDLHLEDAGAFRLVFKARDALKAVHSKADLDLTNIEVLFSAFEMAALFGRLGSLSEEEVQSLPGAMRRLISRTVELSMEFPILSSPMQGSPEAKRGGEWTSGTFPKLMPPLPYESFSDLLVKISKRNWDTVSVITFNYDLGIDFALHFEGIPYRYGFSQDSAKTIDLLKLHGSLNWGRCAMCKEVMSLDMRECLKRLKIRAAGSMKFPVSEDLRLLQHCGSQLKSEPLIVPPTWNKGTLHIGIDRVWKKAARHLSEAEYIFVIGYSYPPTDEFFRYLYALGTIGDGWLEKVMVFNPDQEVGERIKKLLGPLARDKFAALTNGFDTAIPYISKFSFS